MKSVLFFLEDADTSPEGLVSPISKIRRLSISCRSMGVQELILVDLTKYRVGQYYKHSNESFYFRYYTNFIKAVDDFANKDVIIFDLYENIRKNKFYPENLIGSTCGSDVLYVVGPDGFGLFNTIDFKALEDILYLQVRWMYIPCQEPNVLFAEHALLVALYEHERNGQWQ